MLECPHVYQHKTVVFPGPSVQVIDDMKDAQVSKYPLRLLARASFLVYMLGGLTQGLLSLDASQSLGTTAGRGLEYLTMLGFIGTLLTLVVASVSEFVRPLRPVRVFMSAIFLPIETMITLLYWSLYFFNVELILSKEFLEKYGKPHPFVDTAAHLIPFVYLIFEFFYSRSTKAYLYRQRFMHLSTIFIFSFTYFLWITYLFGENNKFPYPFLSEIGSNGRVAFSVFAIVLGLYVYGLASMAYLKFHQAEQVEPVDSSGF